MRRCPVVAKSKSKPKRKPEPKSADSGEPAGRLLTQGWVHVLVVIVASLVAFGSALEGELVWDDPAVVGPAAALRSPLDAFRADLFFLGDAAARGVGASYYRPLVTLTYYLDSAVFSAAPAFGLHLTSLLWHALAAVLVLRALRRWAPGPDSPQQRLASLAAATLWAVMPLKAENVAWISGRGDVIGLVLLLVGLEWRARSRSGPTRVAVVGLFSLAALLCKEAYVVAPIVVAIELWSERSRTSEGEGAWRALLRARELWASALVTAAYLGLRLLVLPVRGGGAAMFEALSWGDRASLFLESLGYAVLGVLTPWDPSLLNGPIGFAAPGVLEREPGMAAAGGAALVIGALVAWRAPRARPALGLFAVALLPVANLMPSGLESRMSDRFLYAPSLALALGLATMLCIIKPGPFRPIAGLVGAAAAVLLALSVQRSEHFISNDALFTWEVEHGNRATTVLLNAGNAAARARRFDEARDLRLDLADRYRELGFGEGYSAMVDALRYQVEVTGQSHPPSHRALVALLTALSQGAEAVIPVELPSGRRFGLPTHTPAAQVYRARRALAVRMWLLVLHARSGDQEAVAATDEEVRRCPDCRAVLLSAADVYLALLVPDRAADVLARVEPSDARSEDLGELAELQKKLLAHEGPRFEMAALFLGASFERACRVGIRAVESTKSSADREIAASSCALAGAREAFDQVSKGLTPSLIEAKAPRLRHDLAARHELASTLLSASPGR